MERSANCLGQEKLHNLNVQLLGQAGFCAAICHMLACLYREWWNCKKCYVYSCNMLLS